MPLDSNLGLPAGVTAWVVAAWLAELVLYTGTAFAAARRKLADLPPAVLAALLTASAVAPYCLYAPASGCFSLQGALWLPALAGALSFWYVLWPRRRLADAGFLVMVAGVALARVWKRVYLSPEAWPPMEALGQLMWIRLGIVSALLLRRVEGVGFGWLPQRREWKIGLKYFLFFLPVGAGLAMLSGFARWDPRVRPDWTGVAVVAGTFLGMLWVVALAEEFFFRGLLQRWLSEWLAGATRGWLAASLLFGLAHLPFREFPNWRFALLAAVAGLFYGRACWEGGGIRAAMVAHALTNTIWRTLLR